MHANASTPCTSNSSLKRFSSGCNARQIIVTPMGFPYLTPLEQAIVLVSSESIRKKPRAGLVP